MTVTVTEMGPRTSSLFSYTEERRSSQQIAMPNHDDRERELVGDNENQCVVFWCNGNALDSEYCWEHQKQYGEPSSTTVV